MFSNVARAVDRPLSRVFLGLFGLVVAVLFGPFSVVLLLADPIQEPGTFLLGLGGVSGVIAWLLRTLFPALALFNHPLLRGAIAVGLAAGIAASVAVMVLIPAGPGGYALLSGMIGAGLILLLGTVARSGPGPNNSSKPTPLRGAA